MFRPLGTNFLVSSAPFSRSSTRFALCALSGALLTTIALSAPAHADTNLTDGSAKTALPGGVIVAKGLRTAVVSATVSEGDAINAQRALVAANTAIARTRDFFPVPTADVASALQSLTTRGGTDLRLPDERRKLTNPNTPYGEPEPLSDIRSPLDAQDFRALGKRLKADRMMTVYVTPGDSSATSATYGAVVELYDTKNGVLVGRGEGTFTSILDTTAAPATSSSASTAPTNDAGDVVVNGTARPVSSTTLDLPVRALGGAVFRAVQELNRPIELRGIVLDMPGPYQARISLSEYKGLRNGARVEFLDGDTVVAYGTTFSVGTGEALVSVAPENAFSSIYVNMRVRNVNNPTIVRAGKTDRQLDDQEFRRFETQFAVDLVAAGLITLAAR